MPEGVVLDERIGGLEVGVEVVQGQGRLLDVQLVDRELARDHERDLGQLDGEGVDVDAIELTGGDEREQTLALVLGLGDGVHCLEELGLDAFELAVGEIEEVARAAGRVEDAVVLEPVVESVEIADGLGALGCAFDQSFPRIGDGGLDDLEDVQLAGEVSAKGVALVLIHGMLEDRAEDLGADAGPVGVGGVFEALDLGHLQFNSRGLGEESAVEVVDALVPPARDAPGGVHRFEETAQQVVGGFRRCALIEQAGEEVAFEQPDVLGEEGDEELEREPLCGLVFDAPRHEAVENEGEMVGGLTSDGFVVVAEDGCFVGGEEECQRAEAFGELVERDPIDRGEDVLVEVVDPELVEIAEQAVGGSPACELDPVVEHLLGVTGQWLATLLHLNEEDVLPDEVGEVDAPAVWALQAFFIRRPGLDRARLAEGLEEAVEEVLGLALFVALEGLGVGHELGELVGAGVGHGE